MHSSWGIEPANLDGAVHPEHEDIQHVMAMCPSIVEDGLDVIILSKLDVKVEAIKSAPKPLEEKGTLQQ
jgi:hypothetical protein